MIFIYKSNHLYLSGSVSVFFAIIMVVLLTFLFSIFDFSRLQFIQLEASSNFETAAEIALSQYEPLLLHQYGMFAGQEGLEVESVFNECLETQFYPDKAQKHTYLLDYYLEESSRSPKFSIMEPIGYEFEINYVPFINHQYNYPREQILDYMKLREPYLVLKPFLSNLDILSKSSRTSNIIEEKNELISSFKSIEAYKLELYKLIDGVIIRKNGDWSIAEESNYVRKFTYSDLLDYTYFPQNASTKLASQVINYKSKILELDNLLNDVEAELTSLVSSKPFKFIYVYDAELDKDILLGIIEKEKTKSSIKKLEVSESKISEYRELSDFLRRELQSNQEALKVITELEEVCLNNIDKINAFQKRLLEKDDLIDSLTNQMNKELNDIKAEMSIKDISFNNVNNLPLIKGQLESNIQCVSQGLIYIESLTDSIDDYIYKRYVSVKSKSSLDNEQIELLDKKMLGLLEDEDNKNKSIDMKTALNLIKFADKFLSLYESDLLFDYTMLESSKPLENEYEEKESGLLNLDIVNLFEEYGMLKFFPEMAIDEEQLPSRTVLPNYLDIIDFKKIERGIDIKETSKKLDLSKLSNLGELASDIHNTLLINEYAIGMFSNVNKTNNPNSKSLNGFKVSEHFLDYETEYILGGHINEQKNMDVVLGYLYGTRMPLNLLHLAMEPSKRTTIMSIANTIAGWWTGGVGAIIIAVIIAGFWALLESIADVFILVSGGRVPLIKTRSTWYTSLDGNVLELFNKGVQRVEDGLIVYMDETKDTIDKALEGITKVIESNRDIDSKEDYILVKSYIEELKERLLDMGEEIGMGADCFSMNFESKLQIFLDESLEMNFDNEKPKLVENPFEDDKSKTIAYGILNAINKEFYSLNKNEQTVANIIEIKNNILNNYKYHIVKYEQAYKDQLADVYEETMKFQMTVLEESVSELMKTGSKIGRKLVVDKADDIKEAYLKKVDTNLKDDTGMEKFIPSFSYEDYLRVYLLLPIVDERTKIARIMDLIQLNTQKLYDNDEMVLKEYYVGIDVKGLVKAKTLFIPNIKDNDIKSEWKLQVYPVKRNY